MSMNDKSSTNERTVSREVCDWITDQGIFHVFIVPGLQIEHLVWEIAQTKALRSIYGCHELGTGFMADGYSRVSGKPGISISIGGPGAAYMLASSIVSRVDDSSVLYITGDVSTAYKNRFCFQDTGMYGTRDREGYKALVDFSEAILAPGDAAGVLDRISFQLGRKLPAHLVIPCDIQKENVLPADSEVSAASDSVAPYGDHYHDADTVAGVLVNAIGESRNPVILAGHRLSVNNGEASLRSFVDTTGIAVATTYSAKGVVPEDHPLSLGIFGYAGTRRSFEAILLNDCDLLIILGADLSERNTLGFDRRFLPGARKCIYIDTKKQREDPEWNGSERFVVRDIAGVLRSARTQYGSTGKKRYLPSPVVSADAGLAETPASDNAVMTLESAIRRLHGILPPETLCFVDSGAHRVVAAHAWVATEPGTFFTSSQVAPMGWAICAAIGAKLARPGSPVVVITGDGCMRMHGMEIATAVRYRLPILYLVSNNCSYSVLKQRASARFGETDIGRLPLIDWSGFARSIGAEGCVVTDEKEMDPVFERAKMAKGPFIIDFRMQTAETLSCEITIPERAY